MHGGSPSILRIIHDVKPNSKCYVYGSGLPVMAAAMPGAVAQAASLFFHGQAGSLSYKNIGPALAIHGALPALSHFFSVINANAVP